MSRPERPAARRAEALELPFPGSDGAGDTGRVASLNRSNGGVPKLPVAEARATRDGLEGDRQRNRVHHGGPDRALCLYSAEAIAALRREGHPVSTGSLGENVTITGLDWTRLVPGVRLSIGEAELEVTDFAYPCRTIRKSFDAERFSRISQKTHQGWSRVYCRVLREGMIRSGDLVRLL